MSIKNEGNLGITNSYNFNLSLFNLFEIQANASPDKIAITDGSQSFTFQELAQDIHQLAEYLQSLAIKQQSFVGIYILRSYQMVVSIFALLKLGLIFVPLDPAYPFNRIHDIIEDSGVQYILTTSHLCSALNQFSDKLIKIDEIPHNASIESKTSALKHEFFQTIYLLYTSGSTGYPKGVLGSQTGLLNRCYWMWENYPFTDEEVCCQKTSLNFVDSLWEIFGSLLQGIKLVILSENEVHNLRKFKSRLNQTQVSRLVLVPSMLDALLSTEEKISNLRLCISSGEALSAPLVCKFKLAYPNAILLNLYGSTEVAGDVTYYDTTQWDNNELSVPIGKPISNTIIYILDEDMQPLAFGAKGKMYVAGAGVALGYWNKEQATREKFLANPWGEGSLYYMGDWGRYRADGVLEYLGRDDEQVKIRGVRVELNEIKLTLLKHPDVKDVVIRAITEEQNTLLLAYVVMSKADSARYPFFSMELIDFLKEYLPSASIPNAIIVIEQFALLPNGKVNKNLLPDVQDVKS